MVGTASSEISAAASPPSRRGRLRRCRRAGGLVASQIRRSVEDRCAWRAVDLGEVAAVRSLAVPELSPLSGVVLWDGAVELGEVVSCRTSGAVRLGFLFLAVVAAAATKTVDFVPGLFPRFVSVCSGAGDELFGSLYRSVSRTASLWFAGGGGVEDGRGAACYITGVLVHLDLSFEDFPSPANPSPDPRSGRLRRERRRRRGGAPSAHGGAVVGRASQGPGCNFSFLWGALYHCSSSI
jgi:hypothetical protein